MTTSRHAGAIAAAIVLCLAGGAFAQNQARQSTPASKQSRTLPPPQPASDSPLNRRGTILNQQTVTRWTSSSEQRYALPSIKIKGVGVKSKAPRGIGKINGSLLPDYVDSPTPTRSGRVAQPIVNVKDGDPFAGTIVRGGPRPMPVYVANPKTLTSGDNAAIARMLRPSFAYQRLSLFDKLMMSGVFPCVAFDWFRGNRTPYAFSPDGYSGGDPNRAGITDPFVRSGNSPVIGPSAPPPPATGDDPEAELTGFEKAGNRLYEGNPEAAVVLLRTYTGANPNDAEAARALALALIDARRTKEGVELMGMVYEQNPSLASSALPADAVGPESELRALVVRTVEHAHKVNTPAAWLTAAMLMQGERRLEPALKMVERAESVGLNSDVARAMRAALKP